MPFPFVKCWLIFLFSHYLMAFLVDTKRFGMYSNGPEKSKLFTLEALCRRGWPGGFGALNSILTPECNIYFRLSRFQSSLLLIHFCYTGRIPVHTVPYCGTEPIRYVTLYFRDRCGAASRKSRRKYRSYMWMVFVPAQELSGTVWT